MREKKRTMLIPNELGVPVFIPSQRPAPAASFHHTYISGHLKKLRLLPPAPSCLFALAVLSMCGSASCDIKKKVGNYQHPIPVSPPPSPPTSPRSTCRTFGHWTLNSFLVWELDECKAQAEWGRKNKSVIARDSLCQHLSWRRRSRDYLLTKGAVYEALFNVQLTFACSSLANQQKQHFRHGRVPRFFLGPLTVMLLCRCVTLHYKKRKKKKTATEEGRKLMLENKALMSVCWILALSS